MKVSVAPASPTHKRKISFRHFASVGTIAVATVGFLSALLSFQTKLSVSLGEAMSPDNFETVPFEFLNDSPYAIDWIGHNCIIHAARLRDGTRMDGYQSFPAFHRKQRIESGQGRTVFCVVTGKDGTKVEAADIGLLIAYKTWFFPIQQTKEFRFDFSPDSTGKIRGLRKPTSDYELKG
ncbi:hypothetical protein [Variovorax paradoxus]|uniref:hypothetical protein n=1 Tax=Variovorax paradoxus TaxID=34073 RepID=UPI0019339461|nr:hypothetical protein INQ48_39800 [Variovorax paradoxus]